MRRHPEMNEATVSEDVQFTDRELDIMSILWKLGSGTVNEVRAHVQNEPGYTSILKMLQILEEKGHVRHESEGRAYRYFPMVAPEAAGRSALGRIVEKIFHGSADLAFAGLVERLAEDRPISDDQLRRMRHILDELAREQGDESEGGES